MTIGKSIEEAPRGQAKLRLFFVLLKFEINHVEKQVFSDGRFYWLGCITTIELSMRRSVHRSVMLLSIVWVYLQYQGLALVANIASIFSTLLPY